MRTFGQKLEMLRADHNMTQADVIRALQEKYSVMIGKGRYSKWENDKEEPSRIRDVAAMASLYKVSLNWLIGLSDDKYSENTDKENYRRIPVLGTIAAGVPLLAQEDIIGHEVVNEKHPADFCLRVKGDSMEGACIYDGDTVFIRKQPEVETGEIAAVIIDGEATLKRFYHAGGSVILRPENSKYKDIVLTGKDAKALQVIGKVTHIKGEVR